jgi:hypothetical protein
MALSRAQVEGCTIDAAAGHEGDVLSCHDGTWRWDTRCDGACLGDSMKGHCEKVAYELPWTCKKEHWCTAGNDAGWHHTGLSKYAFDFSFALGAKVRAARGGKVVRMDFDTKPGDPCYDGCDEAPEICQPKCGSKANVLEIKHADGTIARYVHLRGPKDGLVEGAWVGQGEVVAYAGSTGWSTGPHLHFMVTEKGCSGDTCQSIHIAFDEIGVATAGHAYESKNCP